MRSPHDPTRPLYGLDIETDTSADGLDPRRSAVVAVAVSGDSGEVVLQGDERRLLTELDEHLGDLEPGTIVTWNGARFDLPFLAVRSRVHGLRIGLRLFDGDVPFVPPGCTVADGEASVWRPPDGLRARWGPHAHLDGYRLFRSDVARTTGLSCGLKSLARVLGLAAVEADAATLHRLRDDEVAAYVASDARLARQLVQRRMPTASRGVDLPPG